MDASTLFQDPLHLAISLFAATLTNLLLMGAGVFGVHRGSWLHRLYGRPPALSNLRPAEAFIYLVAALQIGAIAYIGARWLGWTTSVTFPLAGFAIVTLAGLKLVDVRRHGWPAASAE